MNAAASGVNMNAAAAGVSCLPIENKLQGYKCRRCGGYGHNSATCTNEKQSDINGRLYWWELWDFDEVAFEWDKGYVNGDGLTHENIFDVQLWFKVQ